MVNYSVLQIHNYHNKYTTRTNHTHMVPQTVRSIQNSGGDDSELESNLKETKKDSHHLKFTNCNVP
jgi:hypothetical protein